MYAGRIFKIGQFPDLHEKATVQTHIKSNCGLITMSTDFTDYVVCNSEQLTGHVAKRDLRGKKDVRVFAYDRRTKGLVAKDLSDFMSSLSLAEVPIASASRMITRSASKPLSQSSPSTRSASKNVSKSASVAYPSTATPLSNIYSNVEICHSLIGEENVQILNAIDDEASFFSSLIQFLYEMNGRTDLKKNEKDILDQVFKDINATLIVKEKVNLFRVKWSFNAGPTTILPTAKNPYKSEIFRFSIVVGNFFDRIWPIYAFFRDNEKEDKVLQNTSRRTVSLAQYGIVNLHFFEKWESYCAGNDLCQSLAPHENLRMNFTRQGYDLKTVPVGLASTDFIYSITNRYRHQGGIFLVPSNVTAANDAVNNMWNVFYCICLEYYHGELSLPEEPIRSFWSRIIRCLLFDYSPSVYVTEEFQMKKLFTYNNTDHRLDIVAVHAVESVPISRVGAFVFLAVEVCPNELEPDEDAKDYQKLQLQMMGLLLDKMSLFDLTNTEHYDVVESLRVYGMYICGSQYQLCLIRVVLDRTNRNTDNAAPPMSFIFETFSDLLFDLRELPSYSKFTESNRVFVYPGTNSSPLSEQALLNLHHENQIPLDSDDESQSNDVGVKFKSLRNVPYQFIHQNFVTLYNYFHIIKQDNERFLMNYQNFGSLFPADRIIYRTKLDFVPPVARKKNEASTPNYKETAKKIVSPAQYKAVHVYNIMRLFIGCPVIDQLISYEINENGDLLLVLKSLDASWIKRYPLDICSEFYYAMLFIWNGIEFLQSLESNRVIHCNIHPEAIQYDRTNGTFKLTAFDDAVILPDGMNSIVIEKENNGVTEEELEYKCPEVINNNRYSFKTDRWSFGQVVFKKIYSRIQFCLVDRKEMHDDEFMERLSDRITRIFDNLQNDDELNVKGLQEQVITVLNELEKLHQKRDRMDCEGLKDVWWIREQFEIPIETQKRTGSTFLKPLPIESVNVPLATKCVDVSTMEKDVDSVANSIQ